MTNKQKIKKLSIDPVFGILTRPALEIGILNKKRLSCLFIDISNLKKYNTEFGYEPVNKTIKDIFKSLNKKIKKFKSKILIGRWFSGDEILILCNDLNDIYRINEILTYICQNDKCKYISKNIEFKSCFLGFINNISDLKNKIHILENNK